MKSSQIRESFLQFFEKRGHRVVKSSSLIPQDPTLFFTNAGMVQFKQVFTGEEKLEFVRATSSQKCMRVSGKHNDLENVGYTVRHHTFFEMLGNFSFGDYFKKEAIVYAWEFLTTDMKIPKDRLWVTVFREDNEAHDLWVQHTDIKPARIFRFDEKDNFWSMGEVGPCGPCSEIYYDHGQEHSCGKKDCKVGCDCGRYMEIWNLVFMQFDRKSDGRLENLPKPSVDTGMGLERLACVVQSKHSNYDSDLFTDLFRAIEKISGCLYGKNTETDVAMRVIADHLRACTFLIGEGLQPANDGRGYVLRRILRRAIRYGKKLGLNQPFFHQLVPAVVEKMGKVYPELAQNQKFIIEVMRGEEQRFFTTLEKGLGFLQTALADVKKRGAQILSGEIAFALYDTYGFPLDLTELIATENGLTVDEANFTKAMDVQKQKARASWKGSGETKLDEVYLQLANLGLKVKFLGYETLHSKAKIVGMIKEGALVQAATTGDEVEVLTDQTPFYAESGGQVGDQGKLEASGVLAQITDTQTPKEGLVCHHVKIKQGALKVGQEVQLVVNVTDRTKTMNNHTATHLLHAALRKILGEHVKQAGSLVAPDRLRFDFSHFAALTAAELTAVEDLVNEKIRQNIDVQKNCQSYAEAIAAGAMALFGEKYGDQVRVLKIADFSTELCGGTHVNHTGDIGCFKIIEETSVAAGVRRIEALTGGAVIEYLRDFEQQWSDIAKELKVGRAEALARVQKMATQLKKLEREVVNLKSQAAHSSASDPMAEVKEVGGVRYLATRRDIDDVQALREFSDQLKNKLGSGITVLGSASGAKATLIVTVSQDLISRFNAIELCRALAVKMGGSGGGKPDRAQAGGQADGLEASLAYVPNLLVASC